MPGRAKPYLSLPGPWLLAHRGDSACAPENTLPAFDRAASLGADALELDVHRAADGTVFVFHDGDTARLTGAPGTIEARTAAEVARLDAGWGFTPDGGRTFPFRGQGVRVPTLAEVLARYPALRISVDAKGPGPALAEGIAAVVRAAGAEERVCVGSFHGAQARLLGRLLPGVCRFLPPSAVALHLAAARLGLRPPLVRSAYDVAALPRRSRGVEVVTRRAVEHFHRLGVPVQVWTVDDPAEMGELLALGVDGIVTNRPEALAALLGRP